MKRLFATSVACLAYLAVGAAQSTDSTTGSVERPFTSGGQLRMELSAGDYRISGRPQGGVRIEWRVKDSAEARQVRIDADMKGSEGQIAASGPRGNFHVRVWVPTRSDLYVRLTAGDLTVEDIDGNKDIELRAGDMTIDMRRPDDYKLVDVGVWAGDLDIRPLNVSKGGLFRSYRWDGKGPYRLHAHVLAGDLRLR